MRISISISICIEIYIRASPRTMGIKDGAGVTPTVLGGW